MTRKAFPKIGEGGRQSLTDEDEVEGKLGMAARGEV